MNALFKSLSDPTRREILHLLKDTDLTAGEIASHFEISKPSISHHLDLLKRSGLVSVRRDGQFLYYSINTTILEDLMQWVMNLKH